MRVCETLWVNKNVLRYKKSENLILIIANSLCEKFENEHYATLHFATWKRNSYLSAKFISDNLSSSRESSSLYRKHREYILQMKILFWFFGRAAAKINIQELGHRRRCPHTNRQLPLEHRQYWWSCEHRDGWLIIRCIHAVERASIPMCLR